MSSAIPFDLAIFLLGTFAAAFVTGLAGFAFGMVAAGIWLFALTPVQTTTLIVAYALLVQGYSTWRLRRTIIPSRLLPFVVGSAIGIPAGIAVLELASAVHLRTGVGLLLIAFGLYNLLRPKMPNLKNVGQAGDAGIGFLNGVLGARPGSVAFFRPCGACCAVGPAMNTARYRNRPRSPPSPCRYWV
jgi:uncharacterized membrane protein YfcA